MDTLQSYQSDSEIDSDTQEQEPPHLSLPPPPDIIFDKFHKAPSTTSITMNVAKLVKLPVGYFNAYFSIDFRVNHSHVNTLLDIHQNFDMVQKLSPSFKNLRSAFTPLYESEYVIGVPKELHVSLTGNLHCRKKYRDQLSSMVHQRLSSIKIIKPLELTFDRLCLYRNFHGTKLFLALRLSQESIDQIVPIQAEILKSVKEVFNKEDDLIVSEFMGISPSDLHVSIAESEDLSYILSEKELQDMDDEISSIEVSPDLRFPYDSVKRGGTSRETFPVGGI